MGLGRKRLTSSHSVSKEIQRQAIHFHGVFYVGDVPRIRKSGAVGP